MAQVQIVVGSVTGTAENIAEHIKEELADEHSMEVNVETTAEDLLRDDEEILLICTSNTGCGDLPDNLYPLWDEINESSSIDLTNRVYALINVGDSSFPTFGDAGRIFDETLLKLGAKPLAKSLLIDTGEELHPEEVAATWVKKIL